MSITTAYYWVGSYLCCSVKIEFLSGNIHRYPVPIALITSVHYAGREVLKLLCRKTQRTGGGDNIRVIRTTCNKTRDELFQGTTTIFST